MAEDATRLARRLLDQMNGYSALIDQLFVKIVKKVGGQMSTVASFFQNLSTAAEQIAKVIAKNVVQKACAAAEGLVSMIEGLKDGIRLLRRLAKKIIGLLQRGLNNIAAVAGQVVKLMRRFRNLFMAVIEAIGSVVATISPISAILSAINGVRRVLQAMFEWIGDASPVASVLRKVKKLAKSFMKQLKLTRKELKPLPRQIRPLLAG